jgi:hypothetical protein
VREEIYFLDEVEEIRHIHQSEQRGGNGNQAGGVGFGNELPNAEAKHEKDKKAGFEIVCGRGLGDRNNLAGQIKKRAGHQEQAAKNADTFEAVKISMGEQVIEFDEARPRENHHDREENIVGENFVAGEKRSDNDGPENDGTHQPFQKDGLLGWSGLRLFGRFGHACGRG